MLKSERATQIAVNKNTTAAAATAAGRECGCLGASTLIGTLGRHEKAGLRMMISQGAWVWCVVVAPELDPGGVVLAVDSSVFEV